jgi:3-oxoacyl-(acyl-carrier-protein) synthase III
MSRIIDAEDRSTVVLFGDGAGAAVVGDVPDGYGILGSDLCCDGSAWELVYIPSGGSRSPASASTVTDRGHYVKMDGRGVADFITTHTLAGIEAVAAASGLSIEDIDLLVPHQANGALLRGALEGTALSNGRVHYTLDRYGNTGSASVPLTLADADAAGRLWDGAHVMLFGMGAGMSWGGLVLRWWRP